MNDCLDDALRLAQQAQALAESLPEPSWLFESHCFQAQIHRDQGDLCVALQAYRVANELAEKAQLGPSFLAKAQKHIGACLSQLLLFEEAKPWLEQALELTTTSHGKDSLAWANVSRELALVFEALGHKEAATQHWRAARAIYADADIQAGVDECDDHLKI